MKKNSFSQVPKISDIVEGANTRIENIQSKASFAIDSVKNVDISNFEKSKYKEEKIDDEFAAANAWLENELNHNKDAQKPKWNAANSELTEDSFILRGSLNEETYNFSNNTKANYSTSNTPLDHKVQPSNASKGVNVEGTKSFHYDSSSEAITAEDLKV